jgi:WD40 repeat protein
MSAAIPTSLPLPGRREVITAANVGDLEKITVLTGHSDRVTDLAFSGDGAYLASTGYDGKIHLWEVSSWQEVYTLPISEGELNTIAFSPDGSLLASGQAVWDVATGEVVHSLVEHLSAPAHVAFSQDGSQLVVEASRTIKVWGVASWEEVLAFTAPTESRWLFGISYSPDGKWLASGSGGNGTVYFWSAATGELVFSLEQGNERDVHDIAFSPDGTILATGGTDYYARIWDISEKKVLHEMWLIGMYSLALSPDGSLLATAGPDRSVKLWDTQSGKLLCSLPHADELMAVAFSPDGRLIASGGYDTTIVIWGISQ